MNTITWKHESFFSCTYKIIENFAQVGYIKRPRWQRSFVSELHGKQYTFKPTGSLTGETQILDVNNHKIGTITKKGWKGNATIRLGVNEYPWLFANKWESQWSIKTPTHGIIRYRSNKVNYGGTASFEEVEEVLLLAGIYTRFWKIEMSRVALYILMIPILFQMISMAIKFFLHR